ncbi:hypothetical protein FB595_1132 [Sphingobium sp. AEW010]|uniref:hypothetical protein n=2 Tax=Sphingomonadaceae TaxID=41297 RepID=UPI00056AA6D7|nr:hypothetical protein [Sphingomonas sp. LH128]TWD03564.1 hypothetical protein FB595_1132 [Sphingobium sp. AEW010]TWD21232.1 hypothetical protein FB596_113122 [Sphingobium sp. AEW013]TWD23875.1 hypothetical protein FB594_113123 [Sphingobium sp. AEW001]
MTEIAVASERQTAIRLLSCIQAAGDTNNARYWGRDVVCVLHSQSRLQALDFWMRNPDYLANELLTEFETSGERDLLTIAQRIFYDREPDLRRLPMVRYLFGAFEPLDNALAILRAADLIRIKRDGVPGGKIREHLYLLTAAGEDALGRIAAAAPELSWYRDRACIVARVAGAQGGKALKDRQYLQAEYAGTELSHVIQPVTDRVLARLATIMEGLVE